MTDLKSFVQSQLAQQAVVERVDWFKRKEKWLLELKNLFEMIKTSLVDAGLNAAQIVELEQRLQEETLGVYKAPKLTVKLPAGGTVEFRPVASVILGGYGRVDVGGPAKYRVRLIAEDASEDRAEDDSTPAYEREWKWSVYPGVGMSASFPFDEQGLARILAIVTGAAK
ncbi:hypothetical protein [Rhizobacter sp. Root404]|uniref:hypothetical protein n=1 Tax=Rhizobacter sp. Root404 TaxID=1736528 RepID=UPI0006F9D00C|nr:hypothetical protein [Rhizobacter sp. Root404]KQW38436.1 hypothetical protein ASC76_10505 [Rhizobacter sp. Root404]